MILEASMERRDQRRGDRAGTNRVLVFFAEGIGRQVASRLDVLKSRCEKWKVQRFDAVPVLNFTGANTRRVLIRKLDNGYARE